MEKTVITIENSVVTMCCHGNGKGAIYINDPLYGSFETYWGAMSGNLRDFLLAINEDYFTNRLLGLIDSQVYDNKKTFAELRRCIRYELNIPWYKHMPFQEHLRKKINNFQKLCEEYKGNYFVEHFGYFLDKINFWRIDDILESKEIEKALRSIEPIYVYQTRCSDTYLWMIALHKKLKKELNRKAFKKETKSRFLKGNKMILDNETNITVIYKAGDYVHIEKDNAYMSVHYSRLS